MEATIDATEATETKAVKATKAAKGNGTEAKVSVHNGKVECCGKTLNMDPKLVVYTGRLLLTPTARSFMFRLRDSKARTGLFTRQTTG